jgi:hypothetical protein
MDSAAALELADLKFACSKVMRNLYPNIFKFFKIL